MMARVETSKTSGGATESKGAVPSTGGTGTSDERPSYRRVLRHRSFARLWLAQLVSQSGDFIFEVALLWLVLQATHSVLAVGIVVTGTILPAVLLSPIIGVYLDRWDRRRTLIFTNLLEGVVVLGLAALVLTGVDSLAPIFGIVFLLGAGMQVVGISTSAYVHTLLPVEDLTPANSLLSLSGSLNQVVGLALGGVVVALVGVTLPIEYDALSFFVAAVLLASMPARSRIISSGAPSHSPPSFRKEFREGFAFIRAHRFMLEIIAVGMLVNFFGNGLSALFAPYALYVLHGGSAVYGFLGAAVAVGSLIGAGAIGLANTRRTAGWYLFAGGICAGLSFTVLGVLNSIPLALVSLVILGIAITVTNLPMQTLLQAKVPEGLRGRVIAAFGALVLAAGPVGPVVIGWIASRWSVSAAFVISGVAITVIIALGLVTMKALRTIEY